MGGSMLGGHHSVSSAVIWLLETNTPACAQQVLLRWEHVAS